MCIDFPYAGPMTRQRTLSAAWYPDDPAEIRSTISQWAAGSPEAHRSAVAAIVPHAGWKFSGALAFAGLRSLKMAQTVVLVGGHLRAGASPRCAPEDGLNTPIGEIPQDNELRALVADLFVADEVPDNTVEVQLPLVRYLFPEARALYVRCAPDGSALTLAARLANAADSLQRELVVVGSTDLTHYGPAYRFEPNGGGAAGTSWAEQNDRGLIARMCACDANATLTHVQAYRSACSAGAALAAMEYARLRGVGRGRVLRYGSSLDVQRSDSFVGYASIAFERERPERPDVR